MIKPILTFHSQGHFKRTVVLQGRFKAGVNHAQLFFDPLHPKVNCSFPKSANKDTLPVHNMPFETYCSAYLTTNISGFEGCCHFEKNWFKIQK